MDSYAVPIPKDTGEASWVISAGDKICVIKVKNTLQTPRIHQLVPLEVLLKTRFSIFIQPHHQLQHLRDYLVTHITSEVSHRPFSRLVRLSVLSLRARKLAA